MCSLQEHSARSARELLAEREREPAWEIEQQAADRAAFLCHETKDEE